MSLVKRLRQRFMKTPLSPFFLARRAITAALRESAPYVRGTTLDIGCGNKPYEQLFQTKRYVGVDLPSNLNKSDVIDSYASGLALPFADCVFDSVVCSEVLEHVPQPDLLFREVWRVLRPGGHLVLTTPQTWGLHEEPHDYYRYTPYGLTWLAERAGFRVISVSATTGFFETWAARMSDFLFLRMAYDRGMVLEVLFGIVAGVIQVTGWALEQIVGKVGDTLDNVLIAKRE